MIETYTVSQFKKFPGLNALIKDLRTHKKDSLINSGLREIWENHPNSEKTSEKSDVIEVFGSRIILLALTVMNDAIDKKHAREQEFEQFHNDYVNMYDSPIEKNELLKTLESLSSKDPIPEEFLDKIHPDALDTVSIFRSHNLLTIKNVGPENLWTSLKLFSEFNNAAGGEPEKILEEKLRINPIQFIRNCLSFLTFALKNNGRIDINKEVYELSASKISIDEKTLKEYLFEKLNSIKPYEQKYFPNPLYRYPLIHVNKGKNANQEVFLIPSPRFFLYSVSNYLFHALSEEDKNFNSKFGNAIENHIYDVLSIIFGENIRKIEKPKKGKFADFTVELTKCTLVIEIKKQISPYDDKSIMGARNVAKMWDELYSTCLQLISPSNLNKIKDKNKPIISIAIFYDLLGIEHLSFQIFAERSGLFKSLGVSLMEFFWWSDFERILATTSIEKFEEKLLERAQNVSSMNVGEIINFDINSDEKPAHSYEYLKSFEDQLLNRKKPPCP